MYETGRICIKIAGRDAGKTCVIIEEKEGKLLIDGQTRRRYVNPNHVEPLQQTINITKGATTEQVHKALENIGIKSKENKNTYKKKTKKTETKETKPKKETKKPTKT